MKIFTLHKTQYKLLEFHHYIDNIENDKLIKVLELLIETDEIDVVKHDLSDIFVIEADSQSYVFSDYTVSECYESDGYIKVVCVK